MSSDLWNKLRQADLVTGELPTSRYLDKTPLYLRLLVGLGAWVATLFSLGTVYSLIEPLVALIQVLGIQSHSKAIALGVLLMAVIYGVFGVYLERKNTRSSTFSQQLTLTCYLTSQGLLGFALVELLHSQQLVALLLMLINTIVFIKLKSALLKQISSYLILICLAWLAATSWGRNAFLLLPLLLAVAATIWFNLCRLVRWYSWLEPLAQAASTLYILGCLWIFTDLANPDNIEWLNLLLFNHSYTASSWYSLPWINTLNSVISLSFGLVYWRSATILKHGQNLTPLALAGLFLIVFISLVNFWIIGISGFALMLAAAVGIGHRVVVIRLLIGLLILLFMYYYSLHLTLLYKSLLLVISGIVLILLGTIFRRFTVQNLKYE